jgi:hypothetical protein
MRERLMPGTELLMALSAYRMSADGALLEFIDNSFGPAAGDSAMCRIELHSDRVIIRDRGRGMRT